MRFASGGRFVSVVIPSLNEQEPIAGYGRACAAGLNAVDIYSYVVCEIRLRRNIADCCETPGAGIILKVIRGAGRRKSTLLTPLAVSVPFVRDSFAYLPKLYEKKRHGVRNLPVQVETPTPGALEPALDTAQSA